MDKFIQLLKYKYVEICNFKKINPHKHWMFLIFLFIGIFLLIVLYSLYFFYKVENKQLSENLESTKKTPSLLQSKMLTDISNYFEVKKQKEEQLIKTPISSTDPSN